MRGWIFKGAVAAFVVVAAITVARGLMAPAIKTLPSHLSRQVGSLTLVNDDRQEWHNVRVEVNDKYQCRRVDSVPEKTSAQIALLSCIASDGARFNPIAMAPVRVFVTAVQVDDTGEASNLFTFDR